ncbi:PTS sugar transporter subunit IIB [Hydrogenibacillus sp. N12]|uniref:PTS sugar transporter subunit IIB n=1 Tax=Hydrogenibacillus sp. N12 TaxID=2866627 RepID=UPI001C7CBD0E|nr:PTS sugar transporter subunit IIB [Hydrogenibacillus sp. N12]QZA32172.1 PTS sugar transporter subunit IIB [Hydrogenibacillus sp. N12]
MRVLAVCGMGLGSSLILRINVESVLKELGIQASVEVSDVTSAKSMPADLIVTSGQLAEVLRRDDVPIITVQNYLDREEIRSKIQAALGQEG